MAAYANDSQLQNDMLASDQLIQIGTPKTPNTSTQFNPTAAEIPESKEAPKAISGKARKASMIASLHSKSLDGNPKKNWAALTGFFLSVTGILVSFFLLALVHISIAFMAIVFTMALIFSLMGLKSERRKLAFSGLIISLIILVAYAISYIFFGGVA